MCYVHNQWYDILCATLYFKFVIFQFTILTFNHFRLAQLTSISVKSRSQQPQEVQFQLVASNYLSLHIFLCLMKQFHQSRNVQQSKLIQIQSWLTFTISLHGPYATTE